jgi:hypothetical protein
VSGSLRIRSESSKRAEEQGGRARRRTAYDDGDDSSNKFVKAVKDFIKEFGKIAKEANVGHAIGLVDSKDWVIADLNAKINDLEKKNDELKLKPPSSSGAPGAPGASGASEQKDNSQA